MTNDHALQIVSTFVQTTLVATGPVLGVALVIGTGVGVMQTATQVNEPSISYAIKVAGLVGLLLVAGPALSEKVVSYTRASFSDIAKVVH
jgi:flagellar biosynthetic protein FliQ